MWKNLEDLVLKSNRNVIQTVIVNNIEYKTNIKIAIRFNEYFVNSIKAI